MPDVAVRSVTPETENSQSGTVNVYVITSNKICELCIESLVACCQGCTQSDLVTTNCFVGHILEKCGAKIFCGRVAEVPAQRQSDPAF